MIELPHPYGVVVNDAGGANQIAAIVERQRYKPSWVSASGPAVKIWNEYFAGTGFQAGFHWIPLSSAVVTGTGWSSDMEYLGRVEANRHRVRSIAVLDHWVNYRERFIRNGRELLPDEIWVVDEYAESIAREAFPGLRIVRQPDAYSERMVSQIGPLTDSTPKRLLYLLEPMRTDWGRSEPGEFQALTYFRDLFDQLGFETWKKLRLRLHPSETSEKYERFLDGFFQRPVELSANSLVDDLQECRWVAGCQTYAMTIAIKAGRSVFCSMPPWSPSCVLPHKEIVHLRNMKKLRI